ncbi:MAG: FHA domain-containing protein [Nannocystaceae bacterium]
MALLRIHSPVVGRHEQVFEWDLQPITLGRGEDCDVVLLEQAASRRHARLEWADGEATLTDCDSGNGVWVDEERVDSRPLRDGEIFRIGETTVQLVLDPFNQPTLVPTKEPEAAPEQDAEATTESTASPEPATPGDERSAAMLDDLAMGDTVLGAEPEDPPQIESPAPPASTTVVPTTAPAPRAATSTVVPPEPEPEPAPDPVPAPAPTPAPAPAPPPAPAAPLWSSDSDYSLGEAPTLAGGSSPSVYSLGDDLGGPDRGPDDMGPAQRSAESFYSLGAQTRTPDRGPSDMGPTSSSSPPVYSLDGDDGRSDRGHDALPLAPSSSSVYSLGDPPVGPDRGPGRGLDELGLGPSSPSVYSLGDQPVAVDRGPDHPAPRLPPSSAELGTAPPAPAALPGPAPVHVAPAPVVPKPAPAPAPSPAAREPTANSSWQWVEPRPSGPNRSHGHAAGPTLRVGVLLLVAGLVAIIAALATGYEPSELGTLLGYTGAQ